MEVPQLSSHKQLNNSFGTGVTGVFRDLKELFKMLARRENTLALLCGCGKKEAHVECRSIAAIRDRRYFYFRIDKDERYLESFIN